MHFASGVAASRKNESHHFVPQFYLRHWCDGKGRLWVCPLTGHEPFLGTPKSIAAEKGLYDSAGTPFEKFDYEGSLAKLESLFAGRWPEVFDDIGNPETKKHISRFLALMHTRHPAQKETVRRINSLLREMAARARGRKEIEITQSDGERTRIQVSDIDQYAADTEANTRAAFLSAMRASVGEIAQVLNARKWGIIVSDVPGFLTSDRPLVVNRGHCRDQVFGLGSPGTTVTFPISPTRLLLIGDGFKKDGSHYQIESVTGPNTDTIRGAGRFVFARDKPWSLKVPKA